MKTSIYNKVRTARRGSLALLFATLFLAPTMTSCVDTIILPDDMTVDEDFWKKKADVELMVNGAYLNMIADNVVSKLIVWGGLRSDEFIPNTAITGTLMENLRDINLANIQTDNQFANWGPLYTTINSCNIVLKKAAAVMGEDPSYTKGDYLAHCSQMLALRSLCYFYLVRNFRDVPYTSEAFMSSSQDRNIAQSAPTVVLQHCIDDLLTAEKNAVEAGAYNDWRRVGYFTRDAIQALLADIYLWRASVLHSSSDYEQAIAYCDKVIASKQKQHSQGGGSAETQDYWLSNGATAFRDLFIYQNAEESILELQINTNDGCQALCQYYNRISSGNAAPYLYASKIFMYGTDGVVFQDPKVTDWRGFMSTYNKDKTVDEFSVLEIRKFVSDSYGYAPSSITSSYEEKNRSWNNTGCQQNYMVYRLTDVMLMKAEALVALAKLEDAATEEEQTETNATAATTENPHVREAFNLVRVVNARSLETVTDSMTWDNYKKKDMEELVLEERARELAFEGKRWYDLLRYNYRHMEGVDYSTILASQSGEYPETSEAMLTLVKRKLSTKGDAVTSKMGTEPTLYMPVYESDLKVCPVLKQMPTYSSNKNYGKNY